MPSHHSILLLLTFGACGTERQRPADPPASWTAATLADSGFGAILVGMTPAAANAAVGDSLVLPPAGPEGCQYGSAPAVAGLAFMIENGRVVRIEVRSQGVRTDAGAAVGDSETRIQQLYHGRIALTPHKYTDGHYLTVAPRMAAAGQVQLVFETEHGVVTRFRGGLLPQVAYVEGCG